MQKSPKLKRHVTNDQQTTAIRRPTRRLEYSAFIVTALIFISSLFVVLLDMLSQTMIYQNGIPLPGPLTYTIAACCIFILVTMILFAIRRYMFTQSALGAIPRIYLPFKSGTLGDWLIALIHQEFFRVKSIDLGPIPEERGLKGWGSTNDQAEDNFQGKKQSGSFENMNTKGHIHFKKSILASFSLLETAIISAIETNQMLSQDPILTASKGARPRTMHYSEYIEHVGNILQVDPRVSKFFADVYRLARFSQHEIEEEQYKDAMKCLVILLKEIS